MNFIDFSIAHIFFCAFFMKGGKNIYALRRKGSMIMIFFIAKYHIAYDLRKTPCKTFLGYQRSFYERGFEVIQLNCYSTEKWILL